MRIFSPLFVGLLLPLCAFADETWSAFRGPQGDGILRADVTLPTEWSSTENIAWHTKLPGKGWSSPVVADGRIYLSAAVPVAANKAEQEYSLSLLIVDAASGDLLKTIAVMKQSVDRSPAIHAKNSHASPTVILDGDRVFVHFGYQGTACLSRDGDVIWKNRDLYFQPKHGNGGTPALVDNQLIFTCDGDEEAKIVALNSDTGELTWETRRPVSTDRTFSFCTPTVIEVDGQKQVIAPGSDCVLALNPQTGEIIWDVRYTGYSVVPKPVHANGLVFVSTSFGKTTMLAIRPTGTGVVTDTHVKWQVDRNIPKTPSMIAHEGLVYTISDNGVASCWDAESGDAIYQKRVGGNHSASPLLAGDHIYFTSEVGLTTVIRTGRTFEQVAENDIEQRTLASLGVVDDSLLLRTEDTLYRIGR